MTPRRLFLVSFSLCLTVHGALTLHLFSTETRFVKYPQAAAQYLAGALTAERLADLSPGYFYLHLLSLWFGGGTAATPILLLQLLLTALAAALLAMILRDHLPAGWTLFGVVLFVCSRGVIVYTGILEPEVLLLALLVTMVWLLRYDGRWARLASGGALALALLTRPSVVLLLFLVPLWIYLNRGRQGWLSASALFLLLPLLALGLLAGRNAVAFGSFSPTVMNPGFVFFEGNNPLSTGQSSVYPPLVGELKNEILDTPDNPHVTYREVARRSSGGVLSVAETNGYWGGRALAFIADHPGTLLARLGSKLVSLAHSFRWHDLDPAQQADDRLTATRLPVLTLAPLFALALLGLWVVRLRWRIFLLPALLIGMQILVMLVLYVSERQRLVMLPFLILFACLGLQWVTALTLRRKVVVAVLLVIWVLALSRPTGRMLDTLYLWEQYRQSDRFWVEAITLREKGRLGEAAEAAAASLAAAPWLHDYSRPAFLPLTEAEFFDRARSIQKARGGVTPSDRFDAAVLALHAGRLYEAELLLGELIAAGHSFSRVYLQSSHPEYYLAQIALLRGDWAAAKRWAQAALIAGPGDPYTLALLAALTGEAHYRNELEMFFSELDAAWLVGLAFFDVGRFEAAIVEFEKVTSLMPELRRAKHYLAASLGATGRKIQGQTVYAPLIATDPVLLEQEILNLYAGRPGQEFLSQFRSGQVLTAFGQLDKGLRVMQMAAQLSGDFRLQEEHMRFSRLLRVGE